MSERYTKLFTLPARQYSQGAPFIVAAGALHKDNLTETIVAQIKFESISTQIIKAVSVSICPYDIAGRALENFVKHQYLDLSAKRGQEFGAQTLIDLKNDSIRSFDLKIDEVIFEDNSIWTDENATWEQLPEQYSPEERFTDGEIAKQYYIEYGADAQLATQANDLWICACGGLNHGQENVCFKCGKEKDRVLNVDENVLRVKANGRVYREKKVAEDKAKKAKKIKIIAIPAAIVLCIVLILSIALLPKEYYDRRGLWGVEPIKWEMNRTDVENLHLGENSSPRTSYLHYKSITFLDSFKGNLYVEFDSGTGSIRKIEFTINTYSPVNKEIFAVITKKLGEPFHQEHYSKGSVDYIECAWLYSENQYLIVTMYELNDIKICWKNNGI